MWIWKQWRRLQKCKVEKHEKCKQPDMDTTGLPPTQSPKYYNHPLPQSPTNTTSRNHQPSIPSTTHNHPSLPLLFISHFVSLNNCNKSIFHDAPTFHLSALFSPPPVVNPQTCRDLSPFPPYLNPITHLSPSPRLRRATLPAAFSRRRTPFGSLIGDYKSNKLQCGVPL